MMEHWKIGIMGIGPRLFEPVLGQDFVALGKKPAADEIINYFMSYFL